MKYIACVGLIFLCFVTFTWAQADSNCTKHTGSTCEDCLKEGASCLWCNTGKKCLDYPVKHVIPTSDDCALSAARWGVCWLNFEAMIISCSIIGGLLLISITLCMCKCCGCCCFKKNNSKYLREQQQMDRQRQDRKMRQDERRSERKMRNDEIRRKYGLSPSEPQYHKFENE